MHSNRVAHPRMRMAFGVVAFLAATVVACEMPSPEMLAPDGKDLASTRVFGKIAAATPDTGIAYLQKTIAEHFPEVARGEVGPTILYVVKVPGAGIVLTESQPAEGARMRVLLPKGSGSATGNRTARREGAREHAPEPADALPSDEGKPVAPLRVKMAGPGGFAALPQGIGALRPDDIESIDVSKFAAGKIAPNPVSVILIALKPKAKIPQRSAAR